jgi:hypothetical protein
MLIFGRSHSRNRSTSTTTSILAIPSRRLLIPTLLSDRKSSTPPSEPEDERDEPA